MSNSYVLLTVPFCSPCSTGCARRSSPGPDTSPVALDTPYHDTLVLYAGRPLEPPETPAAFRRVRETLVYWMYRECALNPWYKEQRDPGILGRRSRGSEWKTVPSFQP